MKRAGLIVFVFLLLAATAGGQAVRSWAKMSKQEADRILTESAWAQNQTDTDISEMFYSPTKGGTSAIGASPATKGKISDQQSINNSRSDRGAVNQAVSVNYCVRFFSAKPVREAISRTVLLNQAHPPDGLEELMQTLVDRDFSQFIVVLVTFDSNDMRFAGPVIQSFATATAETLRNTTYLERKDGKRLFLVDYRPPERDGLGAKFAFYRSFEGQPYLSADSGTVRFYSEVGSKTKLNVKFKLSDMIYDGKLEY